MQLRLFPSLIFLLLPVSPRPPLHLSRPSSSIGCPLTFAFCPSSLGFFKGGRKTQLYMRSDAHGERMQKVYALDYCSAGFVTEGLSSTLLFFIPLLSRFLAFRRARKVAPSDPIPGFPPIPFQSPCLWPLATGILPRRAILRDPFRSALSLKWQALQSNRLWFLRLRLSTCPHLEQRWLVCFGLTLTTRQPTASALY